MRRIGTLDLLGDAAREALVKKMAHALSEAHATWMNLGEDAPFFLGEYLARAALSVVEAHGRDQAHRESSAEQRPATDAEKHGAQEALRTIEHVGNPQGRTKAVAPEGEG